MWAFQSSIWRLSKPLANPFFKFKMNDVLDLTCSIEGKSHKLLKDHPELNWRWWISFWFKSPFFQVISILLLHCLIWCIRHFVLMPWTPTYLTILSNLSQFNDIRENWVWLTLPQLHLLCIRKCFEALSSPHPCWKLKWAWATDSQLTSKVYLKI